MTMKDNTKQIGTLIGSAITAACCLGLPVVISAVTAIGLGFLIHDAILVPMFMGFVGFRHRTGNTVDLHRPGIVFSR